jgi:hypothetical protein
MQVSEGNEPGEGKSGSEKQILNWKFQKICCDCHRSSGTRRKEID